MGSLGVDIGRSFGSPLGYVRTIGDLVRVFLGASFAIASIIALLFIIAGGITIISSAGKENPEGVEKGKQAVTWAVIGFIVVFVAYWIIRIIELITGIPFITQPKI